MARIRKGLYGELKASQCGDALLIVNRAKSIDTSTLHFLFLHACRDMNFVREPLLP